MIIDFIFGLFGYCKIPKEAVPLSIQSESLIEAVIKRAKRVEAQKQSVEYLNMVLKGQQTLTAFLRSGRLL